MIELQEHHKIQISRLFQGAMMGFVLLGLIQSNFKIVLNSFIGLAVTFLPEILEKDYDIGMSPWLVIWVASAVFFHAFGVFGPYGDIWWWDHFTHTLSATVVAAAGYAAFSAIDNHMKEVNIPERFMFLFILIFVVAFGVLWEVMEFGLHLITDTFSSEPVLTQHGIEDTMKDLLFDMIGAILVAAFGSAHLDSVVEDLERKIEGRLSAKNPA